jgi:hypothetical protein
MHQQSHAALRKTIVTTSACLVTIVLAAGCASTRVTSREELVTEKLPRPGHILVYDFAATMLASANPAGLIISSGMKVYGEESGSSTVEGRAKATAKEIAGVLKQRFQEQGWIP